MQPYCQALTMRERIVSVVSLCAVFSSPYERVVYFFPNVAVVVLPGDWQALALVFRPMSGAAVGKSSQDHIRGQKWFETCPLLSPDLPSKNIASDVAFYLR
jgi:hypothetical protein